MAEAEEEWRKGYRSAMTDAKSEIDRYYADFQSANVVAILDKLKETFDRLHATHGYD